MSEQKPPPPVTVAAPFAADQANEPVTGDHEAVATHGYVKQRSARAEAVATESLADAIVAKVRALWAIALSTVALTVTVLFGMDARSQSKVDGGVAPVVADVAELKKEVKEIKARQQQQDLESVRATTMLENLSRDRGLAVPPPAPKVLPPDGGP